MREDGALGLPPAHNLQSGQALPIMRTLHKFKPSARTQEVTLVGRRSIGEQRRQTENANQKDRLDTHIAQQSLLR